MSHNIKESLIGELDKKIECKILEPKLLQKLILNAENDNDSLMIAELRTTYKNGCHSLIQVIKVMNT
ncbi:MAG: hypothetical protein J6A06_05270 [Fibrobacteraceae bacterium]|nr:hypothetical protein [Fibrobacteraceae bacterium]MBO5950409.1 hypothetical protein [Fibrobacteraceae bacterium]